MSNFNLDQSLANQLRQIVERQSSQLVSRPVWLRSKKNWKPYYKYDFLHLNDRLVSPALSDNIYPLWYGSIFHNLHTMKQFFVGFVLLVIIECLRKNSFWATVRLVTNVGSCTNKVWSPCQNHLTFLLCCTWSRSFRALIGPVVSELCELLKRIRDVDRLKWASAWVL